MKIEEDIKLDYNDVLIRPKRTTLTSRSEVTLERTIYFPISKYTWTGVPIIAANMDTIGTCEIHNILAKHKIITALHKFYTYEHYKNFFQQGLLDPNYYMVSTGITEKDKIKLFQI